MATFWVVSAKKDDTRLKRLAKLIEDCEMSELFPL
ncbi:MAG TPA: YdeI/OmpD-associated family protein [Candidatus Angelobacter sp.]|nr:YdeI/OmpD-associated family protein [Candidatus Angelobacter sp.]